MRLTVLSVAFPFAPVSPRTAGGAEQILATLDRFLIDAGHASLVLAPEGSQVAGLLLATPRVPAEIGPDSQSHARRTVRELLARTVRDFDVDIVHVHGLDFLEYLPASDVPVVVTLHLPLDWYPRELFSIGRARTMFVCVSESQARSWPGQSPNVCKAIENGVDLDQFRPGRRRGNYLLSIGRICPEKAPHLALDAAKQSGLPLYLAGAAFGYVSHRRYFEEMIAPRLTGTAKFLGQMGGHRKRALLDGARCLLISSLAPETSSLAAMESLACGTPVIAFRSGALSQLIDHGRTGYLVDSVEEMVKAIGNVHQLDSIECRKRAEISFSAQRMANQYLDLYKSLAGSAGRSVASEVLCLAG